MISRPSSLYLLAISLVAGRIIPQCLSPEDLSILDSTLNQDKRYAIAVSLPSYDRHSKFDDSLLLVLLCHHPSQSLDAPVIEDIAALPYQKNYLRSCTDGVTLSESGSEAIPLRNKEIANTLASVRAKITTINVFHDFFLYTVFTLIQ